MLAHKTISWVTKQLGSCLAVRHPACIHDSSHKERTSAILQNGMVLRDLATGDESSMVGSRRQPLATQSDATDGAAQRSAVSTSLAVRRTTRSATPDRTTSSDTILPVPCITKATRVWPYCSCNTHELLMIYKMIYKRYAHLLSCRSLPQVLFGMHTLSTSAMVLELTKERLTCQLLQ